MKKILILGARGDLAKTIYKNIDKINNSIYKLERKNIDFLNSNSQKKLFLFIKRIKPDIIINCIGYFDTNKGEFDKIIRSNLYPTWLLIKYFLNNKKRKVKIISIGSSSYNKPRKDYILYTAAKTALNNIQTSAKVLFSGTKINFYVINPPAMKSRMRSKALKLLRISDTDKSTENLVNIAKLIIKKVQI